MEKKVNLIDYLYIFVKWRKLLITNFFIVCVVALVISLLLPKWYESSAVIMPPKSDFNNLNISALVSKLPFGGLGIPMGSEEVQAFMAILKSRTIKEIVIHKFNLIEVYEKKDIERTLEALEDNIEGTLGDEGQILLSVLDQEPKRAAEMANTLLSALDSIYTQLNIQKARNDRIFIEKRFTQNKEDLKTAEERLKAFQEKYGVIDIPEQIKVAIGSAAELQTLIYMTEIELGIKQEHLASSHILILQDKLKLSKLKKKLSELKAGNSNSNGRLVPEADLFIPFDLVPEVGLEYLRLYREVEVQNTIFEFLIQLYEQAKIEEAKDIPSIQVIDYPAVPIHKAKPKRAIIVIVAGLFSLIISSIFVFTRETLRNIVTKGDAHSEKVIWIKEQINHDMRFLRRKKNK